MNNFFAWIFLGDDEDCPQAHFYDVYWAQNNLFGDRFLEPRFDGMSSAHSHFVVNDPHHLSGYSVWE